MVKDTRLSSDMDDDLYIARSASLKPVTEIAESLGLMREEFIPYGWHKAKVRLEVLKRTVEARRGRYVVVTAITPTPMGEGKTTTAIGLTEAIGSYLGRKAFCCIRQPSMGPTFNLKGGAAGGGFSQVLPMEEINLHLTGDIHAVGAAHNLAASAIDGRIYHESRLGDDDLRKRGLGRLNIDPAAVRWRRVVDLCDRSLREIEIGLNDARPDNGSASQVFPRRSGFDITASSELMAILALAEDYGDLRARAGRAVAAFDKKGNPVTLEDLRVAGAATVLLKDALMPNLMQTMEGQPAFVHCGPFANIAHGNSSVVADRIALGLADYVVTECGFGADVGLEKFFNIKSRSSGMTPDAVVLVATVRALKVHGGAPPVNPGFPVDATCMEEDIELLRKGLPNLAAHIKIATSFGFQPVVAVNRFDTDSEEELRMVCRFALEHGAAAAVVTEHWTRGGEGAAELAEAVVSACERKVEVNYTYDEGCPIREKLEKVAQLIYGADSISYTPQAEADLEKNERLGFGRLPVCIAKTPYSLSHDPELKGVPAGFTLPVRSLEVSAGAGFLYALTGDINTMPGQVSRPAYMDVDIDTETGRIRGLS